MVGVVIADSGNQSFLVVQIKKGYVAMFTSNAEI